MTPAQLKAAWPFIKGRFCDVTFTGGRMEKEVYIQDTARNSDKKDCIQTGKGELLPISTIQKIKFT